MISVKSSSTAEYHFVSTYNKLLKEAIYGEFSSPWACKIVTYENWIFDPFSGVAEIAQSLW